MNRFAALLATLFIIATASTAAQDLALQSQKIKVKKQDTKLKKQDSKVKQMKAGSARGAPGLKLRGSEVENLAARLNLGVFAPILEIQQLGKDFQRWGADKVIYAPETVFLRWTPPAGQAGHWEIWKGNFDSGQQVGTGGLAAGQQLFQINLHSYLASSPAQSPQQFHIRAVPESGYPSSGVVVTYQRNTQETTQFTSLGLDPNMLNPQKMFIDLHRLEIINADEEDDEEPYLVNFVVLFDGTKIDLRDIDNSEIRIRCSKGTHGNCNHGPDVGSGDVVLPSDGAGHFEFTVSPLNAQLARDGLVDAKDLTEATTIALFTMAIEEDGTTTDTADKVKDAMCTEVKRRLDLILRCSVTPEVLQQIAAGNRDARDLLPENWPPPCDQLPNCPEMAGLIDCDGPTQSFENGLRSFAKEIGIGEELDNVATWLLPWGIFQALDYDDVIGHQQLLYSFEQIRTATRPIAIDVPFEGYVRGLNEAAGHWVRYRLKGTIGRCRNFNEERCVPFYAPFWHEGKLYSVYDDPAWR